jgi:hypothetical protein
VGSIPISVTAPSSIVHAAPPNVQTEIVQILVECPCIATGKKTIVTFAKVIFI